MKVPRVDVQMAKQRFGSRGFKENVKKERTLIHIRATNFVSAFANSQIDAFSNPYCDALHVQLSQVKHTAQDGLLVPCLQGYRIPIQGELRKEA